MTMMYSTYESTVEQYAGDVTVESELGRSFCFSLRLLLFAEMEPIAYIVEGGPA